MSSPSSVKRRRLNNATNTLSKPFVSPMRNRKVEQTPLKENANAINILHTPYTPSTLAHTVQSALSQSPGKPAKTSRALHSQTTPLRKQDTFTSRLKRTNPEEIAAQKGCTALELQIKSVKNDIDTLEQAAQITKSDKETELDELALKWRLAAQSVAEELFGTVKERVCRMGGVAAWRESEKAKYDRANGQGDFAPDPEETKDDDADCEFDSQGEELPEEEQEFRKSEKRRARKEAEDAADVPERDEAQSGGMTRVWQETGQDDDAFTMDMMLRSLNIELNVIGYDKEAQRWVA